jgi:hypothetical protein
MAVFIDTYAETSVPGSSPGLTKTHLEPHARAKHNRQNGIFMLGACPIDRHILMCLIRYDPELLLLAFFAIVLCVCLWKFMA